MAGGQDFQGFVDEVLERVDIVELISEYAKPKRVGSRYAALCPLHNDKKSPSLSISPDKQLFHCFGCGAGGNAIHFVMGIMNLEFMDALRYLADRVKLPMPEQGSPADKRKREEVADKKQKIYQMNAEAARYFFRNLAGDKGKDALLYLRDRQLTNETIKKFGLGYAPEGWTYLLDYLKEKGYKEQEIFEAGLARRRDNGTYYDVFHDGRVMFPIFDVRGNILGFGGRIMTERDNTGKYINTSETLVFKKKEIVYGLNFAKNDKSGRLILMEGYMDVISLHQAGIGNAVASMGTAMTEEQARLIKKYAGKAVLCYDSDGPGQKATLNNGPVLMAQGVKTKVMTLTDGKDPDEFIKAKGPEMFLILADGAKTFIAHKIDLIKQNYDLSDTEQLVEFTESAAVVLAEIEKPVELELYAKQVAKDAGISVDNLLAQVQVLKRKQSRIEEQRQQRKEQRAFEERTGGRRDLDAMAVRNAERLLLNFMAEDAAVFKKVKESGIVPADFSEGLHRTLAERLFAAAENHTDIHTLLEQFPPQEVGAVTAILMEDKNTENKKDACIRPLGILMEAKQKIRQAELLDQQDDTEALSALDKMLKESRRK